MTVIRHFRQVVLWPLQLMPVKPGQPVQRHWEVLAEIGAASPWRELRDELNVESREIRDAVVGKVMDDPRLREEEWKSIFDGKRMIYGGFQSFLEL